jgi:predicted SnoaL-like aldol condensation-catalyzing enzyme
MTSGRRCCVTQVDRFQQEVADADLVLAFYREVIGQRQLRLLDHFIQPDYIQHSAMLPDGRQALRQALTAMSKRPCNSPAVAENIKKLEAKAKKKLSPSQSTS